MHFLPSTCKILLQDGTDLKSNFVPAEEEVNNLDRFGHPDSCTSIGDRILDEVYKRLQGFNWHLSVCRICGVAVASVYRSSVHSSSKVRNVIQPSNMTVERCANSAIFLVLSGNGMGFLKAQALGTGYWGSNLRKKIQVIGICLSHVCRRLASLCAGFGYRYRLKDDSRWSVNDMTKRYENINQRIGRYWLSWGSRDHFDNR